MTAAALTTLDQAIQFRDRGWRPFPLDHPDLPRCIGKHGPSNPCPTPEVGGSKRGKHPAVAYGTATNIEAPDGMLRTWFGAGSRNIGIACGPSNLLVIDEDERNALSMMAADLGEDLPVTYRVQTSRGWHWYFTPPEGVVLGNRSGRLAEYHIDVRGGVGHGGYVVAAGSVHTSGHVYTAEDPHVVPAPLPEWLVAEIQGSPGEGDPGPGGDAGRWDDEPRYGTPDDLIGQYVRHLGGVRSRNGEFRHELFLAARDGWRLLDVGLIERGKMLDDLVTVVRGVWGADPDDRDTHIVYTEAHAAAQASPWRVLGPSAAAASPGEDTRPDTTTGDGERASRGGLCGGGHTVSASADALRDSFSPEDYDEIQRRAFEAEVDAQLRRLDIGEEARQRRAARDREPVEVLSWDEFLDADQPDYLVPGMLYRDSTAKVYGAPGSTKSYLLLDLALALSHGRDWFGTTMPRTRVHYIAAEGQAVNVARTLGWLHTHDVDRTEGRGWFDMIPSGVLLTDAGLGDYLDRCATDLPGLIILDTKNAMMDGEENSASDVAVMVRAMRSIKDTAEGACVVLVDHTGMSDNSRGRGSNAVTAAMDTEVRVERDNDTGVITAEVTRDKADEPGKRWEYRLRRCDGPVPGLRAGANLPAYVVPIDERERANATPLRSTPQWWDSDQPALPEELVSLSGRAAAAARDVFRVVRFINDPDGTTPAQVRGALREGNRTHAESTVLAALARLVDEAHLDKVSASRYAMPAHLSGG